MRSMLAKRERRQDRRREAQLAGVHGTWHPFAVHVGARLSGVIVDGADVVLTVDRPYAPVSLRLIGAPLTSLWSPADVAGGRLVAVEQFPSGGIRVTVARACDGVTRIVTAAAARWAN